MSQYLIPILFMLAIMGPGTFIIVRRTQRKKRELQEQQEAYRKYREDCIARGEDPDAPHPPAPIPLKNRFNIKFDYEPRAIEAISGPLEGQTFPIDGIHHIGRDLARCHILFPRETFGVSGDHCIVSLTENAVQVKDNGSTFGTYFSNGAKMITDKRYEMKPGTEFYLGKPENRFRVL